VGERHPLLTLVSWAWIAFVIELDNAVEARQAGNVGRVFRISFPMWANGLRLIAADGIEVEELSRHAGASCNVPGLERWGWITVGASTGSRRAGYGSKRGIRPDTVLRPTRAGEYARELWPETVADVEARWERRFGRQVVAALRTALAPFDGALPWAPPEVRSPDGFRTRATSTVADRDGSLVVILGRTLTRLTLEHERDATVAVPIAANVLRVAGPLAGVPRRAGISKEAVAMSASYLVRHGFAARGPDRTLALTAAGRAALDDYTARVSQRDDDALRVALIALLDQRDALSAGFVPPPGCWRGAKPYLAQTERLLADPTAALPRHPMVLHRGGWPDGS
jgi:hypothetical protein